MGVWVGGGGHRNVHMKPKGEECILVNFNRS